MPLLKKCPFFQLFILGNLNQENVFYDILERKNAFLGHKKKKFKKSKNRHFSKGVNPWFWSKNNHFFNFFFKAIQAIKMSFMIFQNEKTVFQAIKTRTSKNRKIDTFFQRIQARKMSFQIFQKVKTPVYAIKIRSLKRRKIDIFPKGLTLGFGLQIAIFRTFF